MTKNSCIAADKKLGNPPPPPQPLFPSLFRLPFGVRVVVPCLKCVCDPRRRAPSLSTPCVSGASPVRGWEMRILVPVATAAPQPPPPAAQDADAASDSGDSDDGGPDLDAVLSSIARKGGAAAGAAGGLVRKHSVASGERASILSLLERRRRGGGGGTGGTEDVLREVTAVRAEAAALARRGAAEADAGSAADAACRRAAAAATSGCAPSRARALLRKGAAALALAPAEVETSVLPRLRAVDPSAAAFWAETFGARTLHVAAAEFLVAFGVAAGAFLPHLVQLDRERALQSLVCPDGLLSHVSLFDVIPFFAAFGPLRGDESNNNSSSGGRHILDKLSEALSTGLLANSHDADGLLAGRSRGSHCVCLTDTPGLLALHLVDVRGSVRVHDVRRVDGAASGERFEAAVAEHGLRVQGRTLLEAVELLEPVLHGHLRCGPCYTLPWADLRGGGGGTLWGRPEEARALVGDPVVRGIDTLVKRETGICSGGGGGAQRVRFAA